MSYQDNGLPAGKTANRIHDPGFSNTVQCARGFIQDQYLRVVIESTGDANTLALATT
jgi:hypothetical protein